MNGGNPDLAGYAGDVTASQAWAILEQDPQAVLIDVRSAAEWNFVGVPDLSTLKKDLVMIAWQTYPGMNANPDFATQVAAQIPSKDVPLLLICRSGGRSRSAAMALTAQGYRCCYNVAGGFEGDLDGNRHRGQTGGWKAAGLPWIQG